MTCPNCEREIESNIAQCPHCGCHFPVKGPSKPIAVPPPVIIKEDSSSEKEPTCETANATPEETAGTGCPKCGKQIAENAAFCKWCGFRMDNKSDEGAGTAPISRYCKFCGRSINVASLYCKWCGHKCDNEK